MHFVLEEQFYKNNESQICPKIMNKQRKIKAQIRMKNTTHHIITWSVSLQVFLQLETQSEQRLKSKLCRTCFMTVLKCIYMMEIRTI